MKESSKAAAEPTSICRACGRQLNGQDPNVVARKFLAALIGQRIIISCDAWSGGLHGVLRRFDNYAMVISPESGGPDVLVLKGPGLLIAAEGSGKERQG